MLGHMRFFGLTLGLLFLSLSLPPPPVHAQEGGSPETELSVPSSTIASAYDPLRDPEIEDGTVELHVLTFGAGDRQLRLHLRASGTQAVEEVCTTPCRRRLERGWYYASVAPVGGGPRSTGGEAFELRDPHTVAQIYYDNRSGLRSVGWAFFTAAAMSLALSAIPAVQPTPSFFPLLLIGLPLAAAFSVPFLVLAPMMDSARVEIGRLPG